MKALIIGGTGTLGRAITPLLLKQGYGVTILSREELKQKEMQKLYPQCRYVLGDIRDFESLVEPCQGKDAVFHFAAMKHVDMAEKNISECIKINLLGTQNVKKACYLGDVNYAVFSSTDKAVLPINAYGMCKALSEKIWQSSEYPGPLYSVFRWGNVLGSRGSVIHSFVDSLLTERKVRITGFTMTRFWIHIDDAARFIMEHYRYSGRDQVAIPGMKAASVKRLALAVANYLGIASFDFVEIPIRPGEKTHETLDYADPDFELNSNDCDHYSDEELAELVKRTLGT